MKPSLTKALQKEVLELQNNFPGLEIIEKKGKIRGLRGNIVIRDDYGLYQGDYDILISVDDNYPFCFPVMFEVSNKIPRVEDRHISSTGLTCVEVEPKQWLVAQQGIRLIDYLIRYAYNYFCGQLYFDLHKCWPGAEWQHQEDGIRQYFYEVMGTKHHPRITAVLERIINNSLPGRNDSCFCGDWRKYKHCHRGVAEEVKQLPTSSLLNYKKLFE